MSDTLLGGFGNAVAAMSQGHMVMREGWNGKGMFIFMQVPATISEEIIPKMQSLPDRVKHEFAQRGGSIHYSNPIAIVKPNNEINGWSPSVADSLASDWHIYVSE